MAMCCLLLCLTVSRTQAQDFDFGQLTDVDISTTGFVAQPAASGLILQEFGDLYFKREWPFSLVHLYHVKIKIFKPEALEYGNIKISYYKWPDGTKETIENLRAVVFTPDGAGGYKKKECDLTGFRTEENKHEDVFIYAMPGVTTGSIIEYRYELATPDKRDFKPWTFQTELPKIHSEYHVHAPEAMSYKVVLTGDHPLSKNNINKACQQHAYLRCRHMVYAMDSVRAFEPEDRMVKIKNYVPALYFNRVDYTYNSKTRDFLMTTWANLDADLKASENFGGVLKNTGFFKRKLKDLIPENIDTLAKARSIYKYINHNIKPATVTTNLKKAFTAGKGSFLDINLMLASALNAYGIKAAPVLVSTRSYGEIDKDMPRLSAFNYVVVKTHINNRDYYLDATDPLMPFGMIPDECFNNEGRVISITDSCYWVKMQPAYKASTNYIVNLTLKTDGSITGKVNCYYSGYSAYLKRKLIKGFSTLDEYREQLHAKNSRIKILNTNINAIDSVESNLWETYDIEIVRTARNPGDQLFFNPYILDLITENPFKTADRFFPVDVGPATEVRFVLTLHLPENVEIENLPPDATLALPNNGGLFATNFSMLNNSAVFSHMIQLNQSIYAPDVYPHLKELYNKIIQAQKADVILKRKI